MQMQHGGEPLFAFLSTHGLLISIRYVGAPADYFILRRSGLKGVFLVTNPLTQYDLLYPTFFQLTVAEFLYSGDAWLI